METRREIDDIDFATFTREPGSKHRGVGLVALLGGLQALELDREGAVGAILVVTREEEVENRIAIEARQTTPHDPAPFIDQRGEAAVPDESEIERGQLLPSSGVSPSARSANWRLKFPSQARNWHGLGAR